jgi:pimeloyl-ACP methyl ester carboxylesterase
MKKDAELRKRKEEKKSSSPMGPNSPTPPPPAAEFMETRLRSVPHLKLLVVKEGSHHIHADAPEAIFEQVLAFINHPKPKL